jgi:hypothetical protein
MEEHAPEEEPSNPVWGLEISATAEVVKAEEKERDL